jgi:hypothetical protein
MAKLRIFNAPDLEYYNLEETKKEEIQSILQSLYSKKEYIRYLHTKLNNYRENVLSRDTSEQDRLYYTGKIDVIIELLKDIDWSIKKSLTKK